MIDEKFINDALSADINPRVIEPISPLGENGSFCYEHKKMLAEREVWEAKQKEGLHVIDILLSHLKQTSHYDGVAISRIYRLRDLLANKDEVQK